MKLAPCRGGCPHATLRCRNKIRNLGACVKKSAEKWLNSGFSTKRHMCEILLKKLRYFCRAFWAPGAFPRAEVPQTAHITPIFGPHVPNTCPQQHCAARAACIPQFGATTSGVAQKGQKVTFYAQTVGQAKITRSTC